MSLCYGIQTTDNYTYVVLYTESKLSLQQVIIKSFIVLCINL